MGTFDSGFKVARLLRHRWFLTILENAGWVNGGRIIGATPDTTLEEIHRMLEHVERGENVMVVVSKWAESVDGNISPDFNVFKCLTVQRRK